MFKKLISNLPFNPGLIGEVRFYAKRLRQEESIRRLGFIFTALAVLVNVIAVLAPARVSLATSPNDLVYGASSQEDVARALESGIDTKGRADIRQIFDYYGITLGDVQSASATTVKSRERDYITTGRGNSPGIDTPVQIPATDSTIYQRSLNVWDIKNYENCYKAITGTATGNGLLKGRQFWVLLGNCGTSSGGCGNITFENIPGEPKLEVVKTIVSGNNHRAGDTISYRIDFRNNGNAVAPGTIVEDSLSQDFEFVSQTTSLPTFFVNQDNKLLWGFGDIAPSSDWHSITLVVRVKSFDQASKTICNAASFYDNQGHRGEVSNPEAERCVDVNNYCPGTQLPLPAGGIGGCKLNCPDGSQVDYDKFNTCKTPTAACESLKITGSTVWNKRHFVAKLSMSPGSKFTSVKLIINDQTVKDFGSITADANHDLDYDFVADKPGSYSAKLLTAKSGTSDPASLSCSLNFSLTEPTARIVMSKKVSNPSQNIDNFNGQTAKPGDTLRYSLTVSNNGSGDAKNYSIDSDNLTDVLEYADLSSSPGASFDAVTNRLTWPSLTIAAGASVTKTFEVKVKNPLPATPPSLSDPLSYDYQLRNVFGNEVVVKLPKPTVTYIYTAATVSKLPSTGAGSSLIIAFLSISLVGYFYYRSRLLAKEVNLVQKELVG